MAFHFPSSPTVNQLYSAYGADFIYNGYAWVRLAVTSTGPQGPAGPAGATTIGNDGLATPARAGIVGITAEAARQFIFTAGYATAGDGGQGLYKRRQTAPTLTTNKAYARSVDTYRADGTTDATHGGWWELVPENGEVRIEQFGGVADSTFGGSGGTDCLQPMLDALNFTSWSLGSDSHYTYVIVFGPGNYHFSAALEIRRITAIRGAGRLGNNATMWNFPANSNCVLFQSYSTTGTSGFASPAEGEATGSTLEGIGIVGKTTSTDHTKAGLCIRTRMTVRDVGLYYIGGNAIEIKGGSSWGAVADFVRLENCHVHSCSRDGLYIDGNDANVCTIVGLDLHGPSWGDGAAIDGGIGGCGVNDSSAFGNNYFSIHIAGFGNRGVQYSGRSYRLISQNPGAGEATTPGTNDLVWYDVGALASPSTQFPAWSATPAVPHRPMIPMLTNGGTGVYDGVYVETGVLCHVPNGGMMFGGASGGTRYSNHVEGLASGLFNNNGFGGIQRWLPGQNGYTYNGALTYAGVGAHLQSDEPHKGIAVWQHERDIDGAVPFTFRYYDKDLQYGRSGHTQIWYVTTPQTTRDFGRGAPETDFLVLSDVALQDRTNGNNQRILGLRDAAPASGPHARGEIMFNMNPTAGGFVGWVCTTAGTPGTWKTFGAISA